jgi:hypothetical protein
MRGGKRAGAGRKAVKIDLLELEKLCALQCTDEELAAWFGVSARTLERRRRQAAFAEVMERGKARGRLSLRRQLFTLSGKGNVAAAIFLAKNILGYRDAIRNEHSGPDGAPIAIEATPDLSRLSDEEFAHLEAFLKKTQGSES